MKFLYITFAGHHTTQIITPLLSVVPPFGDIFPSLRYGKTSDNLGRCVQIALHRKMDDEKKQFAKFSVKQNFRNLRTDLHRKKP